MEVGGGAKAIPKKAQTARNSVQLCTALCVRNGSANGARFIWIHFLHASIRFSHAMMVCCIDLRCVVLQMDLTFIFFFFWDIVSKQTSYRLFWSDDGPPFNVECIFPLQSWVESDLFALSLTNTDKRVGRQKQPTTPVKIFPTLIEGIHLVQLLCKPSCLCLSMCLCKFATINHKHSNHRFLSTRQKRGQHSRAVAAIVAVVVVAAV